MRASSQSRYRSSQLPSLPRNSAKQRLRSAAAIYGKPGPSSPKRSKGKGKSKGSSKRGQGRGSSRSGQRFRSYAATPKPVQLDPLRSRHVAAARDMIEAAKNGYSSPGAGAIPVLHGQPGDAGGSLVTPSGNIQRHMIRTAYRHVAADSSEVQLSRPRSSSSYHRSPYGDGKGGAAGEGGRGLAGSDSAPVLPSRITAGSPGSKRGRGGAGRGRDALGSSSSAPSLAAGTTAAQARRSAKRALRGEGEGSSRSGARRQARGAGSRRHLSRRHVMTPLPSQSRGSRSYSGNGKGSGKGKKRGSPKRDLQVQLPAEEGEGRRRGGGRAKAYVLTPMPGRGGGQGARGRAGGYEEEEEESVGFGAARKRHPDTPQPAARQGQGQGQGRGRARAKARAWATGDHSEGGEGGGGGGGRMRQRQQPDTPAPGRGGGGAGGGRFFAGDDEGAGEEQVGFSHASDSYRSSAGDGAGGLEDDLEDIMAKARALLSGYGGRGRGRGRGSSLSSWLEQDMALDDFESILYPGPLPAIPEALDESSEEAQEEADLFVAAATQVMAMRSQEMQMSAGLGGMFSSTLRLTGAM